MNFFSFNCFVSFFTVIYQNDNNYQIIFSLILIIIMIIIIIIIVCQILSNVFLGYLFDVFLL